VTVLEVIQKSAEFLARKGLESPRLQVELLLGHVLQVPRLRLYLDFERQLTEPQLDSMRALVKRRAAREPLQHIVGSTSFCGLEIKVSSQVLIPRPETEVLAEQAWDFLRQGARPAPAALDFGTGSGCLALAIAQHVPGARIWAVDTSAAALELARENARRLALAERIQFMQGDGFAALPSSLQFDLIVANPPYIPSSDIDSLAPEVRDYDPRLALDGGPDGLAYFRRLAAEASPFLLPAGCLMCEFGDDQAGRVRAIFAERQWRVQAVLPDLSGRLRILVARPAES
jgi:release factor glutamine methyltransferase